MKIACLTPTYKRPSCLRNLVACFKDQDYPEEDCKLFILDDAGQYAEAGNGQIAVRSEIKRFPTLPAKYNALAEMAFIGWPEVDAFAIWEDDDIYLPHFLARYAAALRSCEVAMPSTILSTYAQPKGFVQRESAAGRFHASWAFRVEAYEHLGGWPDTKRLDFDQQFGNQLRRAFQVADPAAEEDCGYIYRWGNGYYHGSQWGECDFVERTSQLERLPSDYQGFVNPEYDEETRLVKENLGCPVSI